MTKQFEYWLRLSIYSASIVLWGVAIWLVRTENFHFFSGAIWIMLFVTALAWTTFGTIVMFWKHRRNVAQRRARTQVTYIFAR